jgi:RNA polymerase primary sigma factor
VAKRAVNVGSEKKGNGRMGKAAKKVSVPKAPKSVKATRTSARKAANDEELNDELDEREPEAAAEDEEAAEEAEEEARAEKGDEPTAEELAVVEKELADAEEDAKKNIPATAKDVLSGYMEQLSHIPLFTPDTERKAAERLVDLEIDLWHKILRQPLAYDVLGEAAATLERDVQELIFELRKNAKKLPALGERVSKTHKWLDDLAFKLRYIDNDKELMEQIVLRLRRAAWTPKGGKVTGGEAKVPFKEMLAIERSRGESLRARNDFVRANLRLVVSVARSFHHVRLPLIDLIQEGNVGLMKAVHRYDHRRGFRFSTYAIWWIRQAIERAIINKGSAVRLPVHVIDSRRQISRAANKLTQKLGRAPSSAELSKTLHMSQTKLDQILAGVHQDPVSLDDPISSDDPRNYLDMVRDDNQPALDESLIRENTRHRIRDLLGLLSPIEKDIIKRRFGMHDGQDQTLDEIGKHYNLSRERVRQIQTQGLMKMRRMCERRKIGER